MILLKKGDGHFTAAIKVLTSSGVAPSTPDTLHELEAKHPFVPPPTLSSSPLGEDVLLVHKDLVMNKIHSFPKGTSCGRDGLRAQHLMDILGGAASAVYDDLSGSITGVVNLFLSGKCPSELGEFIASAPLTPLVKPGGGLRPIVVSTVWRRLVSKVASSLVEAKGNKVGFSMLLVDFKNAFNLVDKRVLLQETRARCPSIAPWVEFCYSRPTRLYYEDSILWSCQGVQQGDPLGPLLFALALHPLVQKINQSCELTLQAWYLDDGTIVGDTLWLPRCLTSSGVMARIVFDKALRASLEKIVTASGPGFGDWQWRLSTLPIYLGGLGILLAGDIIQYAFLASRLRTSNLQANIFIEDIYCLS
ncbi:putative reverse transcriptase domain-containing protein [Tanacetum coccineum]